MRTQYPCVECGTPVFQLTARRKRYCSAVCSKRAWNRKHPRASRNEDRWAPQTFSCTVTVLDTDETLHTYVGFGLSWKEAHNHALEQAEKYVGQFTEVGYVTPKSITHELTKSAP